MLGNAYHLHFRPGDGLIAELGGLHRFMGWERPILTDSGGFQVFSLRETLVGVDDDGVTFRNVYDGATSRFTPELSAEIQRNLGSDIAMCLDHVAPPGVTARGAGSRRPGARPTGRGASAARRARRGSSSSRSVRAAPTRSCAAAPSRSWSSSTSTATRSAVSRSARIAALMFETTDVAAALLPPDKPRYFMGIGDPEGILEVIEAGVDMFDCVLPTRTARTGSALTWQGRLNLRNARYARDPSPLEEDCDCPACSGYSRAYLRHLVVQRELLALRLLSEHNLRFVLELTRRARDAIEAGCFAAYKRDCLERLARWDT